MEKSIFDSLDYLRYGGDFDYSKIPIIDNKHKLPRFNKLRVSNKIDELRLKVNYEKQPPLPRWLPDVDILEEERKRLYGERVDINRDDLFEILKKKVFRLPKFDHNGNIEMDGGNPVYRYYSFLELLENPDALFYRVGQLGNQINNFMVKMGNEVDALKAGVQLSDIFNELDAISNYLKTKSKSNFEQQILTKVDELKTKFTSNLTANRLLLLRNEIGAITDIKFHYNNKAEVAKVKKILMESVKISEKDWEDFSKFLDENHGDYESLPGEEISLIDVSNGWITTKISMETLGESSSDDDDESKSDSGVSIKTFNIDKDFKNVNIQLPDNNILNSTWYDEKIQPKGKKSTSLNHGNLARFIDIIERKLLNDVNNKSYQTFPKTHKKLLGAEGKQFQTPKYIASKIKEGEAIITIKDSDDYVYSDLKAKAKKSKPPL